jgi:hypothetical protein
MLFLDSLFPGPRECYFSLFQDMVYAHDDQYNYAFKDDDFVCRDLIKTISAIKSMADLLYTTLLVYWYDNLATSMNSGV